MRDPIQVFLKRSTGCARQNQVIPFRMTLDLQSAWWRRRSRRPSEQLVLSACTRPQRREASLRNRLHEACSLERRALFKPFAERRPIRGAHAKQLTNQRRRGIGAGHTRLQFLIHPTETRLSFRSQHARENVLIEPGETTALGEIHP